ncbi:MAG: hypothetical protein HY226_06315 [Candidatus Vogelbacteria bacterium]|nr:hypothetical protein [Candidatus Vogelbacteria bacterium]
MGLNIDTDKIGANLAMLTREIPRELNQLTEDDIFSLLKLSGESLNIVYSIPIKNFFNGLVASLPTGTNTNPVQDSYDPTTSLRDEEKRISARKLYRHLSGQEVVTDLTNPVVTSTDLEEFLNSEGLRASFYNYGTPYEIFKSAYISILDKTNEAKINSYEIAIRELEATLQYCIQNDRMQPFLNARTVTRLEATQICRAVYTRPALEKMATATMSIGNLISEFLNWDQLTNGMQTEDILKLKAQVMEIVSGMQKMLDLQIKMVLDLIYGPKVEISTFVPEGPTLPLEDVQESGAQETVTKKKEKPGRLFE